MGLSYTKQVNEDFKVRMTWWYHKLKSLDLNAKTRQDVWLKFMLCWMMLDAFLTEISRTGTDIKKLEYFYREESDFKTRLLSKWNSLKGYGLRFKNLSPIHDMRPGSTKTRSVTDENNLEEVFNFVYQIRCNLFHGAKSVNSSEDYEFVKVGEGFLRICIDSLMGQN